MSDTPSTPGHISHEADSTTSDVHDHGHGHGHGTDPSAEKPENIIAETSLIDKGLVGVALFAGLGLMMAFWILFQMPLTEAVSESDHGAEAPHGAQVEKK